MNPIKKQVKELKDGDVVYIRFDNDRKHYDNHEFFGIHYDLSGTDQIFIIDDAADVFANEVLFVNGGHELYLKPDDFVYYLFHYSELLNKLKL